MQDSAEEAPRRHSRISVTVEGGTGSAEALRGSQRAKINTESGQEVEGQQNTTLVSLFLSGRHSQMEGQEQAQEGEAIVTEKEIQEAEFFPDPPCIAPFEDEDETRYKKKLVGETPQLYWKGHATWKQDDPALQGTRAKSQDFVETWIKKFGKQGFGPDALNVSSLSSKASRRTRRQLTHTKSFGNMDMIEGFVNISLNPIGIRKMSSQAEDQKTGEVVEPGEVVIIDKILEQDYSRFLRLMDGRGWVFDSLGGETIMAKMEEIEAGNTWYRMICKEMVDIRRTPSYDQAAKTSRIVCPKELVVVNIKCRVRGYMFVHLADGRGWIFLMKPGAKKKERSWADTVMEECDAEVTQGETWLSQDEILPVTNDVVEVGLWTYMVQCDGLLAIGTKIHGTVLNSGDIIKVDKRAYTDGCGPLLEKGQGQGQGDNSTSMRWLRIHDGRGWVPEQRIDGKNAVSLQTGGGVSYPSTLKNKFDKEKSLPKWAVGIV